MSKPKTEFVTILNCSKQMIPLNLQAPGGDFYSHSQNVYLQPNKTVQLPSTYINEAQIQNLTKSRKLRIVSNL